MTLAQIQQQAKKEIKAVKEIHDLQKIYVKYLGKKGHLSQVLKSLKDLPVTQRKQEGQAANQLKAELQFLIKETEKELEKIKKSSTLALDVTAPGAKIPHGHLHPISQVRLIAEDIFKSIGFSVVEGPHVTTEYYNFDSLNIPQDHPSRDLMDTFWLKAGRNRALPCSYGGQNLLLRTHTSAMQVPYMEDHQPPLKIIVPGLVFRYEATDASHDVQFYQLEGLMVDEDVSVANFRGIAETVLKRLFGQNVKIRIRPGYFPFTEPSFEIDSSCVKCSGKGCSLCSQTGWLELMGAGMIHPNVLRAGRVDPANWQGFAFGMGLGRIAMIKYRIDDIRLFYSGDLRFIRQF